VKRSIVTALTLLAAVLPLSVQADERTTPPAFKIDAPQFSSAPPIDGKISDVWKSGSHLTLDWDYTLNRSAPETTDVYVARDKNYLYVAFDARQQSNIAATQQANNVGQGTDDEVEVYLWPGGKNGFFYSFDATPRGIHYQSSSENSAYSPEWRSAGIVRSDGYSVTMRIPLAAIRGDGRSTWIAQFARRKQHDNETFEWAHAPNQQGVAQSLFAGSLHGFTGNGTAKPLSRLGVYTLGEVAAPSTGGSTSRVGADIAIPISQTASFVSTIHPDYSNVERDQETISPTAFRRSFSEVRPFFTQGGSFYDYTSCYGCPGLSELYTPSIPTPRAGYQIEGKQGRFGFGAFDAVGVGRIDTAQSIQYKTDDRHYVIAYSRESAELGKGAGNIHDVTQTLNFEYDSTKNLSAYVNYSIDRGTLVLDNTRAQRIDAGVGYSTKTDFYSVSARKVGTYFNPYDGFVSLTDLAGYDVQAYHTQKFGPQKPITQMGYGASVDRYVATIGGTNLADYNAYINAFARNKVSAVITTGSSYVRLPGDLLRPFNQNGINIDYLLNTATQDSIGIQTGRFADGQLVSTQRLASFHLGGPRTTISFRADATDWFGDNHTRATQWLERGSLTYTLGSESSFSIGARKIVGAAPPVGGLPQSTIGTNISFAFSQRRKHDELYFVYGDASAFYSRPAATLKYIRYFGADKGT